MSTFTVFERSKIVRFINVYGNSFTFRRRVLNEYNEPTDAYDDVATISGVFHNAKGGYEQETITDGSRYIAKPQPMILCLQNECSARLMPNDEVEVGSRLYSIVRLTAVGGYGYAWDISLELIDDGRDI